MNYQHHYNKLIERAKTRVLEEYTETHHIVPRCLGGTDDSENLVQLTPEEHYVAHQLLVKIHPENDSLVYAANMMTVGEHRQTNKRYGWLKKKYQSVCKKRTGKKNGSYGTKWCYHPDTLEVKKVKDIPDGWIAGRGPKNKRYKTCSCCEETYEIKTYKKTELCALCAATKLRGRSVKQLDKKMNVIAVYDSISEARRVTGIDRGNIIASIKGTRVKSAGGFYWKYN